MNYIRLENIYIYFIHHYSKNIISFKFYDTGFPIKDARFSNLKIIPDLLSNDKEVKLNYLKF